MSGSILILAGRRPGAVDALAEAHGVGDKCLVPVAGRAMIAHVLESAARTPAERIFVSTHHRTLLDDLADPVIDRLGERLVVVPAAEAVHERVELVVQAHDRGPQAALQHAADRLDARGDRVDLEAAIEPELRRG